MSDYLDQITVGSTTYDIQDSNAVNKSGDTMTGDLAMSEAQINFNTSLSVSTPNSDEYKKVFFINDASNNQIGYVEAQHSTSGNRGIDLATYREINSSPYYNGMQLLIDASGNANVYLTAPSAWRDAIGAVSRSGDTMTENLIIKSSNLEDGVAPQSSSQYGRSIKFTDNNDGSLGWLRPIFDEAGNEFISLCEIRNGSYAMFNIGNDSSGRGFLYTDVPFAQHNLDIRSDNLTDGVAVESSTWGTRLTFLDSQNNRIGQLEPGFQAGGKQVFTFSNMRNINGTAYYNTLRLGLDNTGSPYIETNAPDAWCDALGSESITTISSIATAASDFSIESATFVRWGKLAQINITVERTGTAISSAGNHSVFTLKSGKMPAAVTGITANTGNISYGTINTSGVCTLRINSWAKNASQSIRAVFLLP